jgi:transposase-like protein
MDIAEIKRQILMLPTADRKRLLSEIDGAMVGPQAQASRRHLLDNRMGSCPHCGHGRYVRFGKDKGAQRYRCKSCKRSFTEYTGTWMAGLHKKDKVDGYLALMMEEKSLDKIKDALEINKKTAFDWRHKILSSLGDGDGEDFTGITESDETFFLKSEKGKEAVGRKARKRGGTSAKRGTNDEHVAVIVTQDRKSSMDLTLATMGRIKKSDIDAAIGGRIKKGKTILCSDAHVSYKGFAIDNALEHHALKASIKQRVKHGVYHIQHVNSTHNRIKKWLDGTFWGVATKYLQNYLDWFRVKEKLKNSRDILREFVPGTMESPGAMERYRGIGHRYEMLISTQN